MIPGMEQLQEGVSTWMPQHHPQTCCQIDETHSNIPQMHPTTHKLEGNGIVSNLTFSKQH